MSEEITSKSLVEKLNQLIKQANLARHKPDKILIPAGLVTYAESQGVSFEQFQELTHQDPKEIIRLWTAWSNSI